MSEQASVVVTFDNPCTRCGAMDAAPGGLCMECTAEEMSNAMGAKGARDVMDAVTGQMSLTTLWVDLTPDELVERGRSRWATIREQNLNKRSNCRVAIGGITRTLSEWSEMSGVEPSTLRLRVKRGVTGDALLSPTRGQEERPVASVGGLGRG